MGSPIVRRWRLAMVLCLLSPGVVLAQVATTRVSVGLGYAQADGHSYTPATSGDGRWVAFDSDAGNLVLGDTNSLFDVFVPDQVLGTTVRVSVGPGGAQSNGDSRFAAISADGRWVGFESGASNLVTGDTNSLYDVFLHDRLLGTTARVSVGPGGVQGDRGSWSPSISGDGRMVAFWSPAGNLVAGDTNGFNDVFVHDRLLGTTRRVSVGAGGIQGNFASNVPVAPSAPANLLGLVNGSTLALAWSNTYAGGAPTSLVLDVTGAITTSVPLGVADTFSFAGVPAGTYTLSLRAQNLTGSSPSSNAVTLTFPGVCSGPPDTPASVVAYAVGRTVFVDWTTPVSGPAPTSYVLNVTGSYVGAFPVTTRGLSGAVGPGSYTLSVAAVNACGTSATSAPQTVVVL